MDRLLVKIRDACLGLPGSHLDARLAHHVGESKWSAFLQIIPLKITHCLASKRPQSHDGKVSLGCLVARQEDMFDDKGASTSTRMWAAMSSPPESEEKHAVEQCPSWLCLASC